MQSKYIYFRDGQELTQDIYETLKEYKLFNNINGKFFVNFVGYFECFEGKSIYKIFSYPKEYIVDVDMGKIYTENITCDKEKRMILKTLNRNILKSEDFENNIFSKIEIASNILEYYKERGLYREVITTNGIKKSGKINFKRTIKSIQPIYSNNSFFYENYVIKKNNIHYTIVTESMVYILKEVFQEYPFYFDKIYIDYDININIFKNQKKLINELKLVLSTTFNDSTSLLITNIINYFEKSSNVNSSNNYFCTTQYDLVYELLISKLLGNKFNKTKIFINSGSYQKQENDSNFVILDHYNEQDKIIVDSKYYTYKSENTNVDYKQLFYHYMIVNRQLFPDSTYRDKIEEARNTKNILIKPKGIESNVSENLIVNRVQDGVSLKEYYISMNELIEYNYRHNKEFDNIKLIKSLIFEGTSGLS